MKATKVNITETINALVAEYFANRHENGLDRVLLDEQNVRYHINDGSCEEFAETIADQVEGAVPLWGDSFDEEFWDMDIEYWVEDHAYAHCFIVYEGRYYDAEAPNGVDHPKNLPLYINHACLAKSEG